MMALLTSFFIALMTATQVALGILGVTMIGTLTGGKWFETAQSTLRKSLELFPLLAIFFVPALWYLPHVHLESSGPFLNPAIFDARAIIYWLLWNLWAWKMRTSSSRVWAGLGLLMLLFTMTFAAMDWIMMLDRQWVSSAFGVIFIVDALMGALAFVILSLYRRKLETQPINDFSNLMVMSCLLWIYMHFMEYLVVWQGQIPREIAWYDTRFAHPYLIVVWAVLLLSFILPFPILLFKKLKNNPVMLTAICWAALLARPLEMHGLITPTQDASPWPTLAVSTLLSAAWFAWSFKKAASNE